MDALVLPQQSLFDLCTVYQNLMELVRAHPEDTNLMICFVEAERQMTVAWHADREQKKQLRLL